MTDIVIVDDLQFFVAQMGDLREAAAAALGLMRDARLIDQLADDLGLQAKSVAAEEWRCTLPRHEETFWISLESGSLIGGADAAIAMTRCVDCPCRYLKGPFEIASRQGFLSLSEQLNNVAREYHNTLHVPSAMLADDGLGGGRTMRFVIEELQQRKVPVRAIAVMANIRRLRSIDGTPVTSIGDGSIEGMWLPARDLVWGIPHGGVSLGENGAVRGGIPYFLNPHALEVRAGASGALSEKVSALSEAATRAFWSAVEKHKGRKIRVKDIARLNWIPCDDNQTILGLVDLAVTDPIAMAKSLCQCDRTP